MKRFKHALVIGKFAPLHLGHEHLIQTALDQAEQVSVWCYANPEFVGMPPSIRRKWIQKRFPGAQLLLPLTTPPPDSAPDADHQQYVRQELSLQDLLGESLYVPEQGEDQPIDCVFTSEDYGPGLARTLSTAEHPVTHINVDKDRLAFPISGTRIRENVHEHRQFLSPEVYEHFVERISILGAESTGKSTLAQALAHKLETAWIHEYGAEYYLEHQGGMHQSDFTVVARRHRELEDQAIRERRVNRYLVNDTDARTTQMFSFMMTGEAENDLIQLAHEASRRYRHVFVCDNNVPFSSDHWRASQDVQSVHQRLILSDLATRNVDYTLVSGSVEERVSQILSTLQSRPGIDTSRARVRST